MPKTASRARRVAASSPPPWTKVATATEDVRLQQPGQPQLVPGAALALTVSGPAIGIVHVGVNVELQSDEPALFVAMANVGGQRTTCATAWFEKTQRGKSMLVLGSAVVEVGPQSGVLRLEVLMKSGVGSFLVRGNSTEVSTSPTTVSAVVFEGASATD